MDFEIKSADKGQIVSTGERFIEVTTLFGKDIERKFSFPLETTATEIKKEMKAYAKVLDEEMNQAEANVEVDKLETKADKTIKSLVD